MWNARERSFTILLCWVSLFIEAKITLTLNFLTAELFEVTAADLYHVTQFSYFVVYQRGHPVALKKYILLLFHWGTFVILGTGISKHDCLPHESRELLAGFKWCEQLDFNNYNGSISVKQM